MTILRYWIPILTILVVVSTIPFVLSYEYPSGLNQPFADFAMPNWVKNNAGWWADGQIDDNSFVLGIQYLIKVGIIIV